MLKFFRSEKTKKRIFIGLTVVILPSFLLWGVMVSKDKSNPTTAIASIDSHKISIKEFLRNYKAVEHEIAMFYGPQARKLMRMFNIKAQALDRLVLNDYAKKEKIKTTDQEVVRWLMAQPLFVGRGGFDDLAYKRFVTETLRTTPREFEEELRITLTIAKIHERLVEKTKLSDDELKKIYDRRYGTKHLQIVIKPWETEKDAVQLTDADYERALRLFKQSLIHPATTSVSYLLIPKDSAESLKNLFENNEPLTELAAQNGLKIEQAVIGEDKSLPTQLVEEAGRLKVGGESGWLHLGEGSYKIKVTDKKPATPMTLDESKARLKDVLVREKATQAAMAQLGEIRKKTEGDMEKIAAETGTTVRDISEYKMGTPLEDVGSPQGLTQALESLADGQVSEPLAVQSGAAIVKVVASKPGDAKTFETDKEKLKREATLDAAQTQMDQLLEKLRSKISLNMQVWNSLFSTDSPAAAEDTSEEF